MRAVRHRLFAIVIAVMASQLAGIAAMPLVLCQASDARGADTGSDVTCTCVHAPGAECPMHKHKAQQSSSRQTRWCAGCHDAEDVVLTAVIGVTGSVEARQHLAAPDAASELLTAFSEHPLALVLPPAPRPPRS